MVISDPNMVISNAFFGPDGSSLDGAKDLPGPLLLSIPHLVLMWITLPLLAMFGFGNKQIHDFMVHVSVNNIPMQICNLSSVLTNIAKAHLDLDRNFKILPIHDTSLNPLTNAQQL